MPVSVYRHPTGCELDVPDGWRAHETQLGVQLVPPDAAAQSEIYLVSGQAAQGIDRADDPRLAAYLDQVIASQVPMIQRDGAPAPLGDGVRLRWRATHPMTGASVVAVSMVRILNGYAIGVLALGEPPRVEPRLPLLEAVCRSLRFGQAQRDPQLVGLWHYWSYQGSSSLISGSSHSVETRKQAQLTADGRIFESSSSETSGGVSGKDMYGNLEYGAGWAGQGGNQRHGTWTAGNGMLYIQWSDGESAALQYGVQGFPGSRRLILVVPGTNRRFEWNEQAVRV